MQMAPFLGCRGRDGKSPRSIKRWLREPGGNPSREARDFDASKSDDGRAEEPLLAVVGHEQLWHRSIPARGPGRNRDENYQMMEEQCSVARGSACPRRRPGWHKRDENGSAIGSSGVGSAAGHAAKSRTLLFAANIQGSGYLSGWGLIPGSSFLERELSHCNAAEEIKEV